MADQINKETLLQSLHPNRLPDTAAGGQIAELLVCLGLGLMLGALIGMVIPIRHSLSRRLKALRNLPPGERRLALLYLLREVKPDQITAWKDRLYRPGQMPETGEIEKHLR